MPSISQAKLTEKPPNNGENGKSGLWIEQKFPFTCREYCTKEKVAHRDIYIPDDRNFRNQLLGLVTSQAT